MSQVFDDNIKPKSRRALAELPPRLVAQRYMPLLKDHLARLRHAYDHPNRDLHYDTVLVALLLAFFDPVVRSLRIIEDASTDEVWTSHLPLGRVCKSTLAEALRSMSPAHLLPLIRQLQGRLPGLERVDHDLAFLMKRIIAADGSVFTVPADVAWAIGLTRRNGKSGKQIRLNMQLDVLQFMPEDLSVSGASEGQESASFIKDLKSDVIYLVDRGFVDFVFWHAVFARGSHLVARLKKDVVFEPLTENPLTPKDTHAQVRSDRLGHVPGSRQAPGFGDKMLREVVVWDTRNNKEVRLLTDLLELPADVIGNLYRHRWMIEIFFRWLKCVAKVDRLYSQDQRGITMEFYVAVIGVLLTHISTGRRPSKYAMACMSRVAAGTTTMAQMQVVLTRREHERDLERARLARKKAAKTNP
jgi:Transposase DDE domain